MYDKQIKDINTNNRAITKTVEVTNYIHVKQIMKNTIIVVYSTILYNDRL